jgi:ribosomal peptide maturation radical SAM protein 1
MPKRIVLVNMPFAWLGRPAFGLSLLKPVLENAGFACDLRYLNFPMAELTGYGEYEWIACKLPYPAFAADWTFAHLLYGLREAPPEQYLEHILHRTWGCSEADLRRVLHVRSLAPYFMKWCVAAVPWQDYAIVGFTSTFEQNMASLALARRLKRTYPHICIAFGGANWEGEMGLELHRRFRFVDYVCSGEAETSFPALVDRILSGRTAPRDLSTIPGIVFRSGDESVATGSPKLIHELDRIPPPDYGDYFRDLNQSTLAAQVVPSLLLETSRGCWWGSKSQCAFCGLNGGSIAYRSKSPSRVLSELNALVDRWKVFTIEVIDNILDMRYFHDLIPRLASDGRHASMFWEVKANLKREHVQALREARIDRVQPGIESMSDHVLALMRKGTTALQNVQVLKWCREYGVGTDWNLLYGFPGETAEDYRGMLDLFPAIRFLGPPTAWGPVRLDRFSPFFNTAGPSGFTNVDPFPSYRYLYPFRQEAVARIAYSFDYGYDRSVDPAGFAEPAIRYLEDWKRNPETGCLTAHCGPGGDLILEDTRSNAARREVVLSGFDRAAYEYCDEVRSPNVVLRFLRSRYPDSELADAKVRRFLDSLVANRLMATDGKRYLALALRAERFRPAV